MNTEAAPILELRDVSFAAQGKPIVQDVSCVFPEKRTTALVGPSGGGKSTVLKLAAGLIVPTRGKALYRGHEIATMNRLRNLEFRKNASFVFQDSALWANQTLRQILELPLKIHNPRMKDGERARKITEVLATTGYRKDIDVRPSQLSMGEQKLIAFSRAILCDPKLLFLDEWTESLDDAAARRLVNLVKARKERGDTIVFVSHSYRIIKELADTILMVEDGRIKLNVTAQEFAADENLARTIEKGIAQ